MITNEWTHCPKCGFPANISYFRKVLDVEATCPMCEKPVDSKQLKIVPEYDYIYIYIYIGAFSPFERLAGTERRRRS